MSAAPFVLLCVLAVGLAGVIAWETDGAGGSVPPPTVRAGGVEARPSAVPAPVRTAGLVATVLARPLFSPERRPAAAGVAAEAQPQSEPLPRLSGILVTSAGRSAIFAGEPKATVVQEGAELGRFTVRSIEPGQVVMVGPDGARTVRPSFDPSRPSPALPPRAGLPGLPLLPALRPGTAGMPPGSFPGLPEGPKDAMPFNQNPTPSGLAILRNAATQARNGTPAGR